MTSTTDTADDYGRSPLQKFLPGGVWRSLAGKRVYELERLYPAGHPHAPGQALVPVAHGESAQTCLRIAAPPADWLYLDTETTGLSRESAYAFMVGVGRFLPDGAFRLRQYIIQHPVHEPALLAAVHGDVASAAALVTYNGRAFDLPLLAVRLAAQGFPPLPPLPHLDLLHTVRRLWGGQLQSCALTCAEYFLLGLLRDEDDIPGYQIPQLYEGWLRRGDGDFFAGVCYHNAMDILSLAALHALAAEVIDRPEPYPRLALPLAALYVQCGRADLAEAQYRRAMPQGARPLARLLKRQGRHQDAAALWQTLGDDHEALVELAMYAEHHLRDHALAAIYTERALAIAGEAERPALLRRLERLQKKVVKTTE